MVMASNFLAFQAGWFACVLGGANDLPWLGTAVVAAVVALHLRRADHRGRELTLIILAGAVGALWDSLLVVLGWIAYPSGTLVAGTAPHWMIALWMAFATTLNVTMRWLKQRWLLAAVLGAVSGPLAYYAGHRLGGLHFSDLTSGIIALSIGWAVLLPLLMALSNRLDGMPSTRLNTGRA